MRFCSVRGPWTTPRTHYIQQRSVNETVRAFVAVKVSSEIVDGLLELQTRLRARMTGIAVRWSSEHQLHLTLEFLGNVASARLPHLIVELGHACEGSPQLNLSAAGLDAFPNRNRPRVLWVGVAGDVVALCELQRRLAKAAAGFGDHVEQRDFHPHLTLGRLQRRGGPDEMAAARTLCDFEQGLVGHWRAEAVYLVASTLKPTGAIYSDLAEYPLAESA